MTFSLAGRCARTGALGAVISSSSPAVASRCLWAGPRGVTLSQNVTDPRLGILGLQLLNQGYGAPGVLDQLVGARAHAQWRQIAVLDADGCSAVFTGAKGLGETATLQGEQSVAVGNLLAHAGVVTAMVQAFEARPGDLLAERLLAALEAGAAAGGEAGPVHSAGICVYEHEDWPHVDLRVDWSDTPIAALSQLWRQYAPQMRDYITRARCPDAAPSYGVPGNE
ncbi:DUF1028 domain-containing protein [Pantoea sp. 18069]|uniref:DUF1028 domain-containing protein n=1 Tax=Pantoea sp. 18069 TaxID=2681415 RepID=UPI0013568E61|nr:DUF1028 domain-containing protein [Pantoea sp. 18069]